MTKETEKGIVSDISMHDKVLSASEVKDMYAKKAVKKLVVDPREEAGSHD